MKYLFLTFAFLVSILASYQAVEYTQKITLPSSEVPAALYGSPAALDLERIIVNAIASAKKSIHLAIFTLTDFKVIRALKEKADQGVEVFVVCDADASPQVPYTLGKKIHVIKRQSPGLMHLKVLVIDGKQTWIGSANMTRESLRMHSNLIVAVDSEPLSEMALAKIESFASNVFKPFIHREFSLKDQKIQLWFLPDNEDASKKILHLIDEAKESIKVAMFTWTRRDFAKAIIAAHKRGLKVEVALDRHSAEGASAEVADLLRRNGISLSINRGNELLHNKWMLIDDEILINGSANWTKAAFRENDDCFIILSPLTETQKEFLDTLWRRMIALAI